MDTYASSGVRICLAAQDAGLDISGTFFRLGGEPFTEAKARCIEEAGCRAISHYSLSELGRVGVACAAAASRDDVHLLTDKLAVIQHETQVRGTGQSVPALVFTTLHPSCPLLMLNVATDDFAVVEERDCGCPIGEAGLRQHVREIRSYEKLNSEGMTFFGIDLYHLVEDVLPARFGGRPTDYQLQETEQDGLTRVNIIVDPRIGPVEEEAIISTVGRALRNVPDGEMMTRHWQESGTFQVVRRPPTGTSATKILPLQVLRTADGGG
jgi:phenylacetate-coenzyme A ligase PaaK-like adenylate-forming protein